MFSKKELATDSNLRFINLAGQISCSAEQGKKFYDLGARSPVKGNGCIFKENKSDIAIIFSFLIGCYSLGKEFAPCGREKFYPLKSPNF